MNMEVFDILKVRPEETKVHIAVWNGINDPLETFFAGEFKSWQEAQTKKNFQRKYVLSLIRYKRDDLWLFGGLYESHGIIKSSDGHHYYSTSELTEYKELSGRLIIQHKRKGRNSYPYGESIVGNSSVYELKPERLSFADFSGYKEVFLTRRNLETLFSHQLESWKTALSSVAGVYLISDTNSGKLYVGSAYGGQGIWQRWSEYANNYHGGNKLLKALYKSEGAEYFSNMVYSILETTDIEASSENVIQMESRWKEKLLSRQFGYNDN